MDNDDDDVGGGRRSRVVGLREADGALAIGEGRGCPEKMHESGHTHTPTDRKGRESGRVGKGLRRDDANNDNRRKVEGGE